MTDDFHDSPLGETRLPDAEVQQVLESLPKEKRKILVSKLESSFYSGPIMPPHMLADLEKIIPGGANRVLQMTEKEQLHRHSMESMQTEVFQWQAKASLIAGVIAFLALIVGIIYCAAYGYTLAVSALACVSAFGVISHIIAIPSRSSHKSVQR